MNLPTKNKHISEIQEILTSLETRGGNVGVIIKDNRL